MDIYASEEEQVEAIKKWWKENGVSVILGLAIGVSALFGWRAYQSQTETKSEQASLIYSQMKSLVIEKKFEEAAASNQQLKDEYSASPYASLAALTMAKVANDSGKNELAADQLRWVVDNAAQAETQMIATIRLARIYLSSGDVDAAAALIENVKGAELLSSYHELKGDVLLAQAKTTEAKNAYLQALALSQGGPSSNSLLEMKLDDLGGSSE